MKSTLQVMTERVLVDRHLPGDQDPRVGPGSPVYIDVRTARNPSTWGNKISYRPAAAPGWHASLEIAGDVTIVGRELMKAVVMDDGAYVGMGDARNSGWAGSKS